MEHGKIGTYSRGCRCDECRNAKTLANKKYHDTYGSRPTDSRAVKKSYYSSNGRLDESIGVGNLVGDAIIASDRPHTAGIKRPQDRPPQSNVEWIKGRFDPEKTRLRGIGAI